MKTPTIITRFIKRGSGKGLVNGFEMDHEEDAEIFKDRATPIASTVMEGEKKSPDYAQIQNFATNFRMWKDQPYVRGSVRAKTNSAVGSGYAIKTTREQDNEQDDPVVKQIKEDFEDPLNGWVSTQRAASNNLHIYDLMCLECKDRSDGFFINALDSRYVKLVPSKDKTEIGELHYQLDSMSKPMILQKDDFVFRSMENLGSKGYGISLFEAIKRTLNLVGYAQQYNERQFMGGGVPTLAFIMEESSELDYRRMQKKLVNTKKGAHILLRGKIKVEKIGQAAKDMDFEKLNKNAAQEIMSTLQVPPIMLAMQGGSQGETDKQAMNAFSGEIQANQQILESGFAEAIHKCYGKKAKHVYLDLKPWIDMRQKAATDKLYSNMGAFTPNDIRKTFDMPSVEWGDIPYSPNATPVRFLDMEFPAPVQPGDMGNETASDPINNEGNDGNERPAGQDRG